MEYMVFLGVITHPCLNYEYSLAQLLLKLGIDE